MPRAVGTATGDETKLSSQNNHVAGIPLVIASGMKGILQTVLEESLLVRFLCSG